MKYVMRVVVERPVKITKKELKELVEDVLVRSRRLMLTRARVQKVDAD